MKHSMKRLGSLLLSLAMALTLLPTAALAADETADSGFAPKYTYTNNGYTLEKVSHADVAPGQEDGLADYYEYTDQKGAVHTGVIEHTYTDAEWAKAETRLRTELTARHTDYTAEQIDALIAQIKESLVGDGCQSYSYSAIGYGDWVYIGTMYGGIGIMRATALGALKVMGLTKDDDPDYNNQLADSILNLLYGDHYYVEHVKPTEGILVKINVKTGESKVIMAGSVNGMETTLRGACEYNGKLYFVGAILQEGEGDGGDMDNPLDGNTSGAGSAGMPSIYEVDPGTDRIKLVYQATTVEGYAEMVKKNVFPTLRTIIEYKGSLIASVTDENGAHFIAYTPDSDDFNADGSFKGIPVGEGDAAIRNNEFVEIANQVTDLYDYPAFTTMDSNYGGTVYQIIEFNGDLYAAINAGRATLGTAKDEKTGEDTGCYRGWAIVKGSMKNPDGAVNDRGNWTWTPIVGNTDTDQWKGSDGAKYTFNIDPERYAPGTCTLEVYNGYLYIGDYNDVTLATFGALYSKDFTHLAYNLKQSINLYRLDKDMNVELVVGDATKMFPDGSLTGLGSGYYSHSNQYTAKATVWDPDKTDDNDGILFYSTLDEATILRPLAEMMNGDLLNMSEEEWAQKIEYLKVVLDLLEQGKADGQAIAPQSADEAQALVRQAVEDIAAAKTRAGAASALTEEQLSELTEKVADGAIVPGSLPQADAQDVAELADGLTELTDLVDSTNVEDFSQVYEVLLKLYEALKDRYPDLPEEITKLLDTLLDPNTAKQMKNLLVCLDALRDSIIGCDTYAITTNADGSDLKLVPVTCDGLGDSNNHTMRNFATTDDYLLFCTGNPVKGAQVWRLVDWPGKTEAAKTYTVTLNGAGTGATGAGEYAANDTVKLYAGTKSGYTFSGWTSDDDVAILSADSENASFVMPAKNVTVQANWTANSSSGGGSTGGSTGGSGSGGTDIPDASVPGSSYNYSGVSTCQRGKDCPISRFQDASATAWYHDGVHFCLQNGLMVGVTEDTFQPDTATTRGMIAAMLYRLEGKPAVSGANPFPDVKSGSYCDDATAWAAANGIVTGYESGDFRPGQAITRQEMAAILYRYAQYKKLDTSVGEDTNILSFEDASQLSDYAIPAMQWAVGAGVINGTTASTLSPRGDASRAQVANILYRFLSGYQK